MFLIISTSITAIMPIHQAFHRLIFGKTVTRAQQNLSSPLLNLPVEIILLILDHLPQYQKIILSQTCTQLRLIILERSQVFYNLSTHSIRINDWSILLLWLAVDLISGLAIYALSSIALTIMTLRYTHSLRSPAITGVLSTIRTAIWSGIDISNSP